MKTLAYLSGILVLASMSCSSSTSPPSGMGGDASAGHSSGGSASGGASSGGSASGGATAGAGGAIPGGRPPELPATESQQDITAFLKSGAYKMSPWVSDPAPREAGLSPHPSQLRVHVNATAVASLAAMRDANAGNPPLDQWSMLVKEMYDAEGANLIGIAVAFKVAPGPSRDAWIFWCYGPGNRCSARTTSDAENPLYGNGNAPTTSGCMDCHGGAVLSPRMQ